MKFNIDKYMEHHITTTLQTTTLLDVGTNACNISNLCIQLLSILIGHKLVIVAKPKYLGILLDYIQAHI